MRPILTDTSPDGLRAAIDADIVASRLYNGDVPLEGHEEADVAWAIATDGHLVRPVVAWASFGPASVERRLDELLTVVDERRGRMLWWLAPHHAPSDLAERLLRRGFRHVDDTAAMAMDLARLPDVVEVPAGVRIELVDDTDDVDAYVGLVIREKEAEHRPLAPDAAEVRRRHIIGRLGNDPDSRRFVARLDGYPVATSRLSMAGGAAGLYTVVTLPEARGLGIGRAMTLTALLAGREAGMRIGALQATEMGQRIYARLGFEELFRFKLMMRPRAARRR
jgi:ribosomal protein S18 acetylase RimI-like enzyme